MQDFKYERIEITCLVPWEFDAPKFAATLNTLGNIYIEDMTSHQGEISLSRPKNEQHLDVVFYSDCAFTQADIISFCKSYDHIFFIEQLSMKYCATIKPGSAGYGEYAHVMKQLKANDS